ncbi:hypothetical protein, partial [Ammoniphilus sp. CFH 90114]|uniref:hypothetical protein n=1 Tax=Ammoniphilus sp. CFH 90114 TaxID=2493665 RepID=UPI0013E9145A
VPLSTGLVGVSSTGALLSVELLVSVVEEPLDVSKLVGSATTGVTDTKDVVARVAERILATFLLTG